MVVILFSKKGKAARARSVSPGRALTSETSKMKKELNSELWTPKDYSLAEWVLRTWIGPAVLVFLCPLFVNLAALAMIKYDGSIVDVLGDFWSRPGQVMADAFPPPNKRILSALALFVVFQFVLLLMIPGKTYFGPISPAGERPVHVRNGHKAFALTFIIFYLLSVFEVMDPCIVFDELMPLMTCLNLSALALSVFLLYKGESSELAGSRRRVGRRRCHSGAPSDLRNLVPGDGSPHPSRGVQARGEEDSRVYPGLLDHVPHVAVHPGCHAYGFCRHSDSHAARASVPCTRLWWSFSVRGDQVISVERLPFSITISVRCEISSRYR